MAARSWRLFFLGTLVAASACSIGEIVSPGSTSLDEPSLAASDLAFGDTTVGTVSAASPITITNTHRKKTVILKAVTTQAPFFVEDFTGPVTLVPGAAVTVNVTFRPTTAGTFSGSLLCDLDKANDQSFPLTGTAVSGSSTDPTEPPPPPPSTSACSNVVPSGGFAGCYYDDMAFTTFRLERTDPSIDFSWGSGSPDASIGVDTFSVRWRGNFTFTAGDYSFDATVDDGVRVYVDGALIIDSWQDQAPTNYSAVRTMTAGTHEVKVEFYENGGGASLLVDWAPVPAAPVLASATLAWDPNSETDLAGYRIYQANTSGGYSTPIGTVAKGTTSFQVQNLNPGTYFWVVTAYNSGGYESTFSNEVSKSF